MSLAHQHFLFFFTREIILCKQKNTKKKSLFFPIASFATPYLFWKVIFLSYKKRHLFSISEFSLPSPILFQPNLYCCYRTHICAFLYFSPLNCFIFNLSKDNSKKVAKKLPFWKDKTFLLPECNSNKQDVGQNFSPSLLKFFLKRGGIICLMC